MNILFYLTPKCDCAYLEESDSLRQALEKLEARRYTTIPLLSNNGSYIGTVSEGDLLWSIKNRFDLDLRKAEHVRITDIERRRDYMPISINSKMEDLIDLALKQNFVPVADDNGSFIGIVTRQEIIKYFYNLTKKEDAVS
ncbi:MAG: CBS domain-containing protein [Eubacteriales bacterium]|nr:CBS domain-containing protein [Eubacteriales bacterium]